MREYLVTQTPKMKYRDVYKTNIICVHAYSGIDARKQAICAGFADNTDRHYNDAIAGPITWNGMVTI